MSERIYLDHNASTPIDPQVLHAMMPYLAGRHGNSSSIHSWGRELKKAVEDARDLVAAMLGAQSREITFTSGGTEANNLAILGAVRAHTGGRNRIVTSAIEHASVAAPCKALAKAGFDVVRLPVGPDGCVLLDAAREAIDERTLLVTVMLANNETGAIQPLSELAALARGKGALVHTDAVQCPGKMKLDAGSLGADLLSLGGHKFNGPHGVGALWCRKGVVLEKVLHGADHEKGMRPGTHNVPGIVGLGEASRLVMVRGEEDSQRVGRLSAALEDDILRTIPGSAVNGPPRERRLPNTLNARFQGIDGESLLLRLDMQQVAISTGSACHSGGVDPSPVLLAMGLSREAALSSIRISLGRGTSEEELGRFLAILGGSVGVLRAQPSQAVD